MTTELRPESIRQPGIWIHNRAGSAVGRGTLGCLVRKRTTKEYYVLGCYHVMKARAATYSWSLYEPRAEIGDELECPPETLLFTRIHAGVRTRFIDAAIAGPVDRSLFSPSIPQIGVPRGVRHITSADLNGELGRRKVCFFGAKSRYRESHLRMLGKEVPIHYPGEDRDWRLRDTLLMSAVSRGGDSGALVLDMSGLAIGMLVAGDAQFSYVTPIQRITEQFQIDIVTPAEGDS